MSQITPFLTQSPLFEPLPAPPPPPRPPPRPPAPLQATKPNKKLIKKQIKNVLVNIVLLDGFSFSLSNGFLFFSSQSSRYLRLRRFLSRPIGPHLSLEAAFSASLYFPMPMIRKRSRSIKPHASLIQLPLFIRM